MNINVDGKKLKMMCKLRWRAKYIKRPKNRMLQSNFEHLKGILCVTIFISLCTTEKREDAIFIHQTKNVWIQGEQ
jgi:hypothetical protein